jgi:hypothetical protein
MRSRFVQPALQPNPETLNCEWLDIVTISMLAALVCHCVLLVYGPEGLVLDTMPSLELFNAPLDIPAIKAQWQCYRCDIPCLAMQRRPRRLGSGCTYHVASRMR